MLARLIKASKEKDQGFTLIELLVVIVIIGILAAIAIPLFLSQREKGVDASIKSDLKNAATQLESYSVEGAWSAVATNTVESKAADFTPTSGNAITFAEAGSSTAGYCLVGNATDADATDNDPFYYDSTAGGLVAACAP